MAGFLRLYAAFDLKLKEQVAWGTTQSYQVGARLHIGKDLPLSVAYTYRTGFEERGQLYDQKVTRNLVGLYLEL